MKQFPNLIQALQDFADHPRPGHPAQEAYAWAVKYEEKLKGFKPQRPIAYTARMLTGLTQDEFAEEYDFNVHALRKWEQGTRRPRGANLSALVGIINYYEKD